jgi:hypothetical protein
MPKTADVEHCSIDSMTLPKPDPRHHQKTILPMPTTPQTTGSALTQVGAGLRRTVGADMADFFERASQPQQRQAEAVQNKSARSDGLALFVRNSSWHAL